MNVDDLEKTSVVDDVFNTIIGGYDLDPDDEDSKEPEMESGKESSKTNVDPQSTVQADKCITYCDRLLELLYKIHGLKSVQSIELWKTLRLSENIFWDMFYCILAL
jgi:hypothetical protein